MHSNYTIIAIFAQATQPDAVDLMRWLAYFPADLLLAAILGSAIAAAWVYQEKMAKGADPAQPGSASSVWLSIALTMIIGVCLATITGAAACKWFGVEEVAYRLLVGGGIGLFGVPITATLMAKGPWGILKDPLSIIRGPAEDPK